MSLITVRRRSNPTRIRPPYSGDLIFNLDPSRILGPTNGGSISLAPDDSANKWNLSQGTASKKPVLTLGALREGVITGDGIDDTLASDTSNTLSFERTDKFTMYFVVRRTDNTITYDLATKYHGTGSPLRRGWGVQIRGPVQNYRFRVFLQNTGDGATNRVLVEATTTEISSETDFYILTWVYRGTSLASGVDLYIDNLAQAIGIITNNLSSTIISTGLTYLYGGGVVDGASFAGDTALWLVYNKAHNPIEVGVVNKFISIRTGLELAA